mgnify:CR=1 FL=1
MHLLLLDFVSLNPLFIVIDFLAIYQHAIILFIDCFRFII